MIDAYTRLLEAVADTEDKAVADAAVTRVIQHLNSTGGVQMLSQILRELRTIAARRHALRPRVEVASKAEAPAALKEAAAHGITVKKAIINPSLIRGWRAMHKGILIDHSAKHALIQIYQKVTV